MVYHAAKTPTPLLRSSSDRRAKTMKLNRLPAILVAAIAVTAVQAQSYVAQEVTTGGYANAISNGVVGGIQGNRAVIWNATGVLELHPAGASFSGVMGRSGDVSVGYAGTASLAQWAVVWNGTAATTLATPFVSVASRALATDGIQAVGYGTEGDPERGVGPQHALLWNLATGSAVDLGKNAYVYGVGGGQQAGAKIGSKGTTAGFWRGTANSYTDLHIRGANVSIASDTDGVNQVGYYGVDIRVRNEAKPRDIRFYSAGYWTGSAASFNYLPNPYRHSFATAIQGDTIVGYGNTSDPIGTPIDSHAGAWVGPNHDWVDLHALLPADMRTSRATDVDEDGNIVGYGVTTSGVLRSFVWLRQ